MRFSYKIVTNFGLRCNHFLTKTHYLYIDLSQNLGR
jgi:hypothetical protein